MSLIVPNGALGQQVPVQLAIMPLTLRDWIAVNSLSAVERFLEEPGMTLEDVAKEAYRFSDLMLKAREGKL